MLNEQRMVTTIAAAVKSTDWQGSDGIITEGADTTENNDGVGFKGVQRWATSCDPLTGTNTLSRFCPGYSRSVRP